MYSQLFSKASSVYAFIVQALMSCQHDEHIVLQALMKENERRKAEETEEITL